MCMIEAEIVWHKCSRQEIKFFINNNNNKGALVIWRLVKIKTKVRGKFKKK